MFKILFIVMIYLIIKETLFNNKKTPATAGLKSYFNPNDNINQSLLMAEGSGSIDSQTNVIAGALNSMNFIFNELTEENGNIVFQFPVKTNHLLTNVRVINKVNDKTISMIIALPIFVPELKRNAVYEFIGMINYDYNDGAFEMDHRDGEIRLRSEIPFYDRYVLSAESISSWLNAIFGTMDYTIPGFIAVAYSNAVPAEIWKNIQNAVDPKLN